MKTLRRTTLMLAVSAMLLCQQALAREWTDSTGKFKTQAELVEVADGVVSLKKDSDGAVIQVPLTRLSAADQAYLKSLESQPGELAATPIKAAPLPLNTAGCVGLLVLDPKPILQHKALGEAPLKDLVEQGVAQAGIDFLKIDRVTIMSYLPEKMGSEIGDVLAVVVIECTEPVDPQPVLDMVPGGFEEITVAGKACLKLAESPAPMAPLPVFCVIDEKTFAIGTSEKALADAMTATSDDAEMTALFDAAGEDNEVRYFGNIAAMEGLIDEALAEVPTEMLPPEFTEIMGLIKKTESFTFTVDLDGEQPSIEVLLATADEATAGELLAKIKEGIDKLPEMVEEAAKNAPAAGGPPSAMDPAMAMQMVGGAVENIDQFLAIEQEGATVKMSAIFPEDTGPLADKIMEAAKGFAMLMSMGGGGGPFGQ